jgi:peptidoglycan/LPS O-acetylase OafA/YrhL
MSAEISDRGKNVTSYRAEIDGLRAVSVILVLLFHLASPIAPGGFVGVDVFFVISGYLISGILVHALKTRTFSVTSFYERRVRRIIPALMVVIAFCLIAGFVLLTPGDYRQSATSALYALAGVSNVYFLDNTGYFDGGAEFMPLLHTWSLGVEEQFYLVWPMFLFACFRLSGSRKEGPLVGILCVIAVSFALALWTLSFAPKAAFYLPHTRGFELAAGALLAILPRHGAEVSRWLGEAMPLAGLGLIVWSALTLSSRAPYPGWEAIYPVLGAALVLYQSPHRPFAARLLSTPPLVFIGKISYSLYLWHWPLLVYWRHFTNGAALTQSAAAGIGACSVLAAWLSFSFVEQPFRKPVLARRAIFSTAATAGLILAIIALMVVGMQGFPDRIAVDFRTLGDRKVTWLWPCPQDVELLGLPSSGDARHTCVVGADWHSAKLHALLWGDSHAQHLMPLFDLAGREANVAIAVADRCPAILHRGGVQRYWSFDPPVYNDMCAIHHDAVVGFLRNSPDLQLVILASAWSLLPNQLYLTDPDKRSVEDGLRLLRAGLDGLLVDIAASGRNTVVFADVPSIPLKDPAACGFGLPRRGCSGDLGHTVRQNLDASQIATHAVLRAAADAQANVIFFAPEDYLCDPQRCRLEVRGEFLYQDDTHFRRNMTEGVRHDLADLMQLRELLRPHQTDTNATPTPAE